MRSKESLLRNFFGNVDVVLRRAKLESSAARWDVSGLQAGCWLQPGGALSAHFGEPGRLFVLLATRHYFLMRVERRTKTCCWLQEEEVALAAEVAAAQQRVHEALCDNINTQVRGTAVPSS